MSGPARPGRARGEEPAEQRRRKLRAQGMCIDCGAPATGQRCTACLARVEGNTNRYRGQGKRGTIPKAATDRSDIARAIQALHKAYEIASSIATSPDMPRSDRRLVMIEAVSQVSLGVRFATEVLIRNGAAKRAPDPATEEPST